MVSLRPWRSVEYDDEGIATIVVNDRDLINFPLFMHHVIQDRIGMDMGFFKVQIDDTAVNPTKLSDLISYIKSYFSTLKYVPPGEEHEGRWVYPDIDEQLFFYAYEKEHIYGYHAENKSDATAERRKKALLKTVAAADTFTSGTACCMNELSKSVHALTDHYWEVIRRRARKSVGADYIEDDVDDDKLLQKMKILRQTYCIESDSEDNDVQEAIFAPVELSEDSYLRRRKLQRKSKQEPEIMYGAGIPLHGRTFPITSNFDLSSLGTVLEVYPTKVEGISAPYLYVGTPHASFPWHTEDGALFSINYVHFGSPCCWLLVAPKDHKAFREWAEYIDLDPSHVKCSNILGAAHKYLMASKSALEKRNIKVYTVIQREREIVITYPFTAHSGFKCGWNIQQAANFGDKWWVEPAILAPTCKCYPYVVHMDLKEIIALCRPKLLSMYLQRDTLELMKVLARNKFIATLGILPASLPDVLAPKNDDVKEELEMDIIDEGPTSKVCEKSAEQSDIPQFQGARCVLYCPAEHCPINYEGGRAKIMRMQKHIEKKHNGCPDLLEKLKLIYPPKQRKSNLASLCPFCGEMKAGGINQLKLHIARMHPKMSIH